MNRKTNTNPNPDTKLTYRNSNLTDSTNPTDPLNLHKSRMKSSA